MNLWLVTHFLLAALFLSSSAVTPEECQPLVKPRSLADISMILGRLYFLAGYNNNDVYRAIMNVTDSYWMNVTSSPDSSNQLLVSQEMKLNGVCLGSTWSSTIEGDTMKSSFGNLTSDFHLLPSCDGCVVLSANSSITNVKNFLEAMNITNPGYPDEVSARALYVFGRQSTLKDSDLENFKQQAGCLGFSGELDYHYNADKDFCQEGEGIRLQ